MWNGSDLGLQGAPLSPRSLNGFRHPGQPWCPIFRLLILSWLLAKDPDICPFPRCLPCLDPWISFSCMFITVHLLASPSRCKSCISPEDYLRKKNIYIYIYIRIFSFVSEVNSNQPREKQYELGLYGVLQLWRPRVGWIRCGCIQGAHPPPHLLCVCVCVCVCLSVCLSILFSPLPMVLRQDLRKWLLSAQAPFLSVPDAIETETCLALKSKEALNFNRNAGSRVRQSHQNHRGV